MQERKSIEKYLHWGNITAPLEIFDNWISSLSSNLQALYFPSLPHSQPTTPKDQISQSHLSKKFSENQHNINSDENSEKDFPLLTNIVHHLPTQKSQLKQPSSARKVRLRT